MYTLYKFHFLNGISEINQFFADILIIWLAPVYIYKFDIIKIINNSEIGSVVELIYKISKLKCQQFHIKTWFEVKYTDSRIRNSSEMSW